MSRDEILLQIRKEFGVSDNVILPELEQRILCEIYCVGDGLGFSYFDEYNRSENK